MTVLPGDDVPVSSYTVSATASGAAGGICQVTGASGNCTITGLTAATQYSVLAVAMGPGGTSPPTRTTVSTTFPGTPPSRPQITGATYLGSGVVRLSVTPGRSRGSKATTSVACTSARPASERAPQEQVRGHVERGHVDLAMRSTAVYSCAATTSNATGESTSTIVRVVRVSVLGTSGSATTRVTFVAG